jgi:hypothetical protein
MPLAIYFGIMDPIVDFVHRCGMGQGDDSRMSEQDLLAPKQVSVEPAVYHIS